MKFLISLLFILSAFVGFSQENTAITIGFKHTKVADAFVLIEKKYHVKLSYTDNLITDKIIFLEEKTRTLKKIIEELSEKLNLNFEYINTRYIVVTKKDAVLFNKNTKQLQEIVITGYLARGISKNKDATFKIKPKNLEILPGLIEADILESIQELPGVMSPNETATGLNVRGGTADQNQIIWDGINIYHNGHLFGMISTFNPNITQDVTFYNKGVHPRFGERISSVIDISTSNTIAKKTHVGIGLNGISADAFLETPLIKDKLSVLVSYRKSYEGVYETEAFERIEQKVFQSTKINDVNNSEEDFYFKDYNLKINYTPNKNNVFSASFIHIDNDLDHYYKNTENSTSYRDILDTENDGYSFSWRKKWNDNIQQTTQISYSNYRLNYNFITLKNGTQISDFDKRNSLKDTNISSEIALKTALDNTIHIGYQSTYKDVSYSFLETTNLLYVLDRKNAKVNTHSLFTNYINRSFSFFDFDIGLRANYYSPLNKFRLEPRFMVFKDLNTHIKIQATGEIRNQIISQIEETVLSDLSLENKLWRLSDNTIAPIINSKQFSIGALYHNNGWSFDIDSYYKKVEGITALSLGFLSDGSERFHKGRQKVLGTDFYLKKNFNPLKIWVSYSYIDIKNLFDNINNDNYFTASNQIKHAISSSVSYKTKKLQIAMGWKWHTGKPYTISTINPADNSIVFNGINTERLANYHRLDLSSMYHFSFSEKHKLKGKIGISIRNLLDQQNHISREYTGNNTPNDPIIVVDKFSITRITNFVFRVFW